MIKVFAISLALLTSLTQAWATDAQRPAHTHSHGAHAHGKGELELTVQANLISGTFRTPMDSLLGFEHQPKTDAQKKAVAQLRQDLANPTVILLPNAEAKCSPKMHAANSAMFTGQVKGSHSELEYQFSFECAAPEKLTGLEFNALKQFKRLSQVRVQIASPKGQRAVVLNKKNHRLTLD
jgi:hypothetical protein